MNPFRNDASLFQKPVPRDRIPQNLLMMRDILKTRPAGCMAPGITSAHAMAAP